MSYWIDAEEELDSLHGTIGFIVEELIDHVCPDLTDEGLKALDYLAKRDIGLVEESAQGAPRSALELLRQPFIHHKSDLESVRIAMTAIERYFFGIEARVKTLAHAKLYHSRLWAALQAVEARKDEA